MKERLTVRQQEVLDFISRCLDERGYPPTLREIGEHMGIRSTNGVNDHLKALERKGHLFREGLKSRALRPVDQVEAQTQIPAPPLEAPDMVEVAVIGRVAAGAPILAEENVVDRVKIDRFFLGRTSGDVFGLVVQGESMVEAGIHDGDYLFVRKQPTAAQGEIIVAMIDGEATCKYFFRDQDTIRLEPANSAMSPILIHSSQFRSVHILGKVVGVYRRMH